MKFCTPTCTWCSYYRSLIDINTLASEVKCLRVIKRRDLSNERKARRYFIKAKARARYNRKRRRPLYATATRSIPKRRRPLYATATTQILNLSNLLKGSDIKRTSRRTVLLKGSDIYQEDVEENRAAKRQRYQEDVEETALLKGRNTRTIQLPLRHLKGIGIGMTPLSDWLNVLPRGSGIAGSPNYHYHYHPKVCHGMLYCTSIKKL